MSYKIIVLFSGNGSNLQAIHDNNRGYYEITNVITDNPNAYGLVRAGRATLPALVIQQRKNETREYYCEHLGKTIDIFSPDLVVLAGFMKILSPTFCKRFEGRCINIHPSLLPKHKGLNTHQRVLDAGDTTHGISIHWVTEELDAGEIIVQESFRINPDDTVANLEMKSHALEHAWYPWVINQLAKNIGPNSQ